MNEEALTLLRDMASTPGGLADARAAEAVVQLVDTHRETLRAEAFWGVRAPMLNDELLLMRQLEFAVRLTANGGTLSEERKAELVKALGDLDVLRATQGKAAGVAS